MNARLIAWNQPEDIAVFELQEATVVNYLPLPQENVQHAAGDVIGYIGYNGEISGVLAHEYYNSIPLAERPPFEVPIHAINKTLLVAERKSLSPGQIITPAHEIQAPTARGLFTISCSGSGGSSGSPVFLFRQSSDPILLGAVLGAKMDHNFNHATVFTRDMIRTINGEIAQFNGA